MSKSNIQNNDIDLATSPDDASEVTLQAGVSRITTDVYGNKTEFRAVVLSPPIPLTATEVRLFYGDERLPANEKLQKDLATKRRFMFRGRILDGDVPSPHMPLPDPCSLFDTSDPQAVNNIICMHTMFYSGEYSGESIPSVGDTVKVLLEPAGTKYNLQYGHFVDIDDTVQRRRYLGQTDEQCKAMSDMFGNVAALGGNPSRKAPVEFGRKDPEPYFWKKQNPNRNFEQIGAIYYGAKRDVSDIKFIVIHTTEGGWQSTKTVFTEGDRTASAHYVLKENGDLVQMVPENVRAYHAAHGQWNAQSIGIEIIGYAKTTKDKWIEKASKPGPFNTRQDSDWYLSLYWLLADICARYNINPGSQGLPGVSSTMPDEAEDDQGNKVYLFRPNHKLAFHMHSPGNGCGGANALLLGQGKRIPASFARCHWDPGPGFVEAFAGQLHSGLGHPQEHKGGAGSGGGVDGSAIWNIRYNADFAWAGPGTETPKKLYGQSRNDKMNEPWKEWYKDISYQGPKGGGSS